MSTMASQITSLTIVYSTVYSGADQSSASLAFCVGNSPFTGVFPAQRASGAENVSIWWRHHVQFHIHAFEIFHTPCYQCTLMNWVGVKDLVFFLWKMTATDFRISFRTCWPVIKFEYRNSNTLVHLEHQRLPESSKQDICKLHYCSKVPFQIFGKQRKQQL